MLIFDTLAGKIVRSPPTLIQSQQAKIIALVEDARKQHGDSLASIIRDGHLWKRLVRNVERVVKAMPLWKLQTVGKEKLDFLYEETKHNAGIELRPGVAHCFRQFYSLISCWLMAIDMASIARDTPIAITTDVCIGRDGGWLMCVR